VVERPEPAANLLGGALGEEIGLARRRDAKPSRAYRIASASKAFQATGEPIVPRLYSCACHQPSTAAGTVSEASPPRAGMAAVTPRAAYQSMVAARAARPTAQSARSRWRPAS
jgi:hypothetical protein